MDHQLPEDTALPPGAFRPSYATEEASPNKGHVPAHRPGRRRSLGFDIGGIL